MSDTLSNILTFGADIGGPVTTATPDVAPPAPVDVQPEEPKRRGRPSLPEDERKRRRNERDRERARIRSGAPKEPKAAGAPRPKAIDAFAAEVERLKSAYAEAPPGATSGDPVNGPMPITEKPFISGYVLLLVADVLFPALVAKIFNRDPSGLHLTDKERAQLEPIADRAAMDLLGHVSPVQLFLLTTFAMYAGKAQSMPKLAVKVKGQKAG